ncbi:uncharacterized protein [Rutidosis leptorrhynchoides]|uniref:uncharacterized protein n=1 Tax=Rutidosis leptorrhynchoides TaxID=125765 RepID=UPI003A98D612
MWSKGNIHDRVIKLHTELYATQAALDINPNSIQLRIAEKSKLQAFNEALLEDNRFLKQKAKVECLRVGDSNSSYFHKVVKERINRNHISVIFDQNDNLVEGADVSRVFSQHYETFLGSVTSCVNIKEPGPASNDEVKLAMFDIGNDKASDPDGYSSVFFKESWDIVGDKIIMNRITSCFEDIVQENQSAFILGRRISDNILLTRELMRNYHLDTGVPLVLSRLHIRDCKPLVEMVKKRINDWKNKFLSFPGRVQLISSVLESMQIYWYSVFVIPDTIIKEIEKLIRGFLWCKGEMKRGKAKVKWGVVCLPKIEGGLEIKRLK